MRYWVDVFDVSEEERKKLKEYISEAEELKREWYVTFIKIIREVVNSILEVNCNTNAYIFGAADLDFARILGGNWYYFSFTLSPNVPYNIFDQQALPKEAILPLEEKTIEKGEGYKVIWVKSIINPKSELVPKEYIE